MDKGSEKEGGGVGKGKGKGKASLSEVESLSALSGNQGLTIGPNTLSRQLNSSTNNSSSSSLLLTPTFDNLRRLRIDGCNTLKHVLPISLSQALQQLEALVISHCSDLEEIIVNNNNKKEAICKTLFPRLKNLELLFLPKLSMVSTGVFLYDWPSLEAFKIQKCPNLKSFPVNLRTATKLRAIEVKERWGEWFDGLEWDDSLASKSTKLCFLLCGMFPQGSIISRDDLLLYMVGEGLFGDIYTLSEARNKLRTHMERLKQSCLLSLLHNNIEEGKEGCVKIYDDDDDDDFQQKKKKDDDDDVIRDMSISFASKEDYDFIVKSGGELTHWLDGEYLKCKRLSLMQNKITRLPNRPDCSQLITLSLRGNEDLDIPGGFFEAMRSLKTLDLENTCISSIPSSLQWLVDLRVLRISWSSRNRNRPSDVSLLGKLKKLEILHLQDSEVHNLPIEIGELTNLKSLNLSRNRHLTITQNTLSGLSRLEELNLEDSFHEWRQIKEDRGKSEAACFSEVISLSALVTLNLRISKIGCLGEDIERQWENLTRFLLIFGNLDWSKMHISVSQCATGVLISGNIPALSKWAEDILLERVEGLQLRHCHGLQHLLSLGRRGFNKLRILHVDDDCDGMEYLLSNCADEAFSRLEVLHLKSLPKLKVICREFVPSGCFNKLRFLHLLDCGCLVIIICSDLLAKLPNLEELMVWDCYSATEVFNSTELDEGQAAMKKLKRLNLLSLTSLRTIWKGVVSPLTLLNLEEIRVEDLGLNFMFSLAMAQRLKQLKQLEIRWCREMKKIISMEGDENTQGSSSSTLLDPSTSNVSSSSSQFQISIFGNLRRLCIAGCNSLKQILPMSLAQGLLQLEVLDIRKCSNLEEIIVNDDETKEKEAMCKTVFPQLRYLRLRYLQKLSTVSKGILSHDWPSLETLKVWECPKMEEFHVSLRTATKLDEIVVEEEWFNRLKLDDDKIKDKLSYLKEKGVKVIFEEYSGRSPDDQPTTVAPTTEALVP